MDIDVQELNQLRALLCHLQDGIRDALLMARDMAGNDDDDFFASRRTHRR